MGRGRNPAREIFIRNLQNFPRGPISAGDVQVIVQGDQEDRTATVACQAENAMATEALSKEPAFDSTRGMDDHRKGERMRRIR